MKAPIERDVQGRPPETLASKGAAKGRRPRTHRVEFDPEAVARLPLFDAAAAAAFRAIASDEKFVELMNLYLENLNLLRSNLTRLKGSGAVDEIGGEAHKLIMSSGTFGARRVLELALLLQTACKNGDALVVPALTDGLLAAALSTCEAMRDHYGAALSGAAPLPME